MEYTVNIATVDNSIICENLQDRVIIIKWRNKLINGELNVHLSL